MSYFADYAEHAGADVERFFKSTLFQSQRLLLGLNCLEPGQAPPSTTTPTRTSSASSSRARAPS
ncbi:MAG TPA: hypothetical protein VG370_22010, partial [Chloroflexota bacterium]|nr:hypothetical protein [Chloroflexota bacterium]